jgi:cystathionine beta-lyase
MAPSKTFNVAGLGCSFAIVPNRAIRRRMVRGRTGVVSYVNVLGYAAAQAAYESGDEWNRQQLDYLRGNRDLLMKEINSIPGLQLGPIEATYLAWIDISALELDKPMAFFEDAGVGLSPGRDFGDRGYMRLNFACPRSRVEKAIDRIRLAIARLV